MGVDVCVLRAVSCWRNSVVIGCMVCATERFSDVQSCVELGLCYIKNSPVISPPGRVLRMAESLSCHPSTQDGRQILPCVSAPNS